VLTTHTKILNIKKLCILSNQFNFVGHVVLAMKSDYVDKKVTRLMFVMKMKFVLSEMETDFDIYIHTYIHT